MPAEKYLGFGSNRDRKSQFSGILAEPLNPRELDMKLNILT